MRFVVRLASAILFLGSADLVLAAEKVSLESLLPQMTDLSRLCEFPDPPFVAKQFSSYDRASQAPGSDSWFANGDRGFMLYDGVIKQQTPYFKGPPSPGMRPLGRFAAGTRVGIAPTHRRIGGYVWAYVTAADGRPINAKTRQGYVAQSAIAMDPQGHVLAETSIARLTKARDYGIVQFHIDGKPLGPKINCFNADSVVTKPIDLGIVELKAGACTLRVEVVGTDPKSEGLRYMWGLDCVVLKPGG